MIVSASLARLHGLSSRASLEEGDHLTALKKIPAYAFYPEKFLISSRGS